MKNKTTRYPTCSRWTCDECGKVILRPRDGVVEWIKLRTREEGLDGPRARIVHHYTASPLRRKGVAQGCYIPTDQQLRSGGVTAWASIADLLGDDGLTIILSMVKDNVVPMEEWLHIIQRIRTPFYEEAHALAESAWADGTLDSNLPPASTGRTTSNPYSLAESSGYRIMKSSFPGEETNGHESPGPDRGSARDRACVLTDRPRRRR